ncbi:aminotransferase class V-fold PLP-dependent enzyme [Halobacteriovorax sp. YZS-1-1]|uniref:aminotransferase class V-fold PLP-dependent enzyme n=1 Tax=unclassified Halobacteriovorax TaxID=2639665 RepID=UPI0039997627
MALEIDNIRNQFPQLERKVHDRPLIYLDNAASTLKHISVIEALNNHYTNDVANIHRGVHYLSEHGTIQYEQTRDSIQDLLNAKSRCEIIFTKGTTDSLNLVAASFVPHYVKKDDVILISTMEHHSNIVPWQIQAEKIEAKVKEIPITDDGDIDEEAYVELLKEGNVKLVSMAHISNSLGTINDIKKYISLAHDHGAYFCVDAAQSIAHEKVDVKDLNCDFLAFSSHKMFGPTGFGVLYGKEKLLESMPPYQGGGDMIDVVTIEKTTYNELPHKFEAGTPHIAGGIGLKPAIDFLIDTDLNVIKKYEKELLDYATQKITEIEKVQVIGTAKQKASVLSFVVDGAHPHDLGTLLDRQGVAIRTGHHCTQPLMKRFNVSATARASFSLYNTKEEIDIFIKALNKALNFL